MTLNWVKRSSSGYFFITMVLALVIPLVLSQNYLSKAAYEVIEVNNLNDIRHYPKQKYFRVDDFEPLKSEQLSYIETQVISERYFDSTFHIDYYIATPSMLIAYKIFNKKYREIYGATMIVILTILLSSMFVTFINTLSYMAYYLLTLCFGIVFGRVMVMTQKQSLLRSARRQNL